MQELNGGCSLGISGNRYFGILQLLYLASSLEIMQGKLLEWGDVRSWCPVSVSPQACATGCETGSSASP